MLSGVRNSHLPSMSIWLKSMPLKAKSCLARRRVVIRLGIVGTNYGRTVQLPAFRADSRCGVIARARRNPAPTAELAQAAGVVKAYGDWRGLVEDKDVQVVAIATLPSLQAQIAIHALQLRKATGAASARC